MGIKLFEYNQTAYKAALNLMKQNGKAAVIHPTGTGKSFIGLNCARIFQRRLYAGCLRPSIFLKPRQRI